MSRFRTLKAFQTRARSALFPAETDLSTPHGRAVDRLRRAAWTSLSSLGARAVSALGSLVTVPYVLSHVGPDRYGLWMTVSAAVALLGIADLGLGNSVTTATALAHGRNDLPRQRSIVTSGLLTVVGVAAAILVLFLATARHVAWKDVYGLDDPGSAQDALGVTLWLVVSITVGLPAAIVSRLQAGLQQGYIANVWAAAGSLLGIALTLLGVFLDWSFVVLVAAASLAPPAANAVNALLFFLRSRPDLRPRSPAVTSCLRMGAGACSRSRPCLYIVSRIS